MSRLGLVGFDQKRTQVFFSEGFQLSDVIEWVLTQTGAASLLVSSFSVGDESLRKLHSLRQSGKIKSVTLVCDSRAMVKTRTLLSFMKGIASRVLVGNNHSKVVIADGAELSTVIVTSQNMTRGNRFEAGVVSADPSLVEDCREAFNDLITQAVEIYDADKGTD